MKLLVIGFGQCGSNIADQFARINRKARGQRGIEIVTGAFAVNTDLADLSRLTNIKADYRHRILIGGRKAGGHGVGKINELGAEIAREDTDKIIDAIRGAPRFYESDAFLLIASAAGGTGSGSIAIISQAIKERFIDKPLYNIIVLPFEHEERTEQRSIYNSAVCLRSASAAADAIFLIDNQRYIRKDATLRNNLSQINTLIVEPFYNLLCAGEEKKTRYIGTRLLDAGDIIQTLSGWTVIGYGKSTLPAFRLPFRTSRGFRDASTETNRGIEAMDESISELSFNCNPRDAARALYLVSAPTKEMNVTIIKELGEYLKSLVPEAIIRNGDYPREKGSLEVSVVLSELRNVENVKRYYLEAASVVSTIKKRRKKIVAKSKEIDEYSKDVPSLL